MPGPDGSYETERLVQRLTELEIDTHNIVVNQILDQRRGDHGCKRCDRRGAMQQRYLEQIEELYAEDFHVVKTPQLLTEVRGLPHLLRFGELLMNPYAGLVLCVSCMWRGWLTASAVRCTCQTRVRQWGRRHRL